MTSPQSLFYQKLAFIAERVAALGHEPLSAADVAALGDIGMKHSPSAAPRFVALWLVTNRHDLYRDQLLALAIGQAVRWIAVVRRDEGEEAARTLLRAWEEAL